MPWAMCTARYGLALIAIPGRRLQQAGLGARPAPGESTRGRVLRIPNGCLCTPIPCACAGSGCLCWCIAGQRDLAGRVRKGWPEADGVYAHAHVRASAIAILPWCTHNNRDSNCADPDSNPGPCGFVASRPCSSWQPSQPGPSRQASQSGACPRMKQEKCVKPYY